VRNSTGEAWVTEPDSTSTVDRSSETCAWRAKAATASEVRSTATEVSAATTAAMETTTTAAAVWTCPTSVSQGDRYDANYAK
jgi:hypothetical protein